MRFDPVTERFAEFKSVTPRNAKGGSSASYGMASDPEGNLWWTQISFDLLSRSDGKTGKSVEFRLPPLKEQMDIVTAADQKFYDDFAIPADSFAKAVAFAMSKPDDVDINEILFRPTRQEF